MIESPMGACGALFSDPSWLDAWSQATVERIHSERRFSQSDTSGKACAVAMYDVSESALWRGYEDDARMRDVLPPRVAYLSSLYAISSPINRLNDAAAVLLVDEAIEQARQWGCEILAVTNLESPSILTSLSRDRPPLVSVRLDATCRAHVPETSDEFLASLSKSARSDVRRRHRRAREQNVEFCQRWGQDAEQALPRFLKLTEMAASRHGNAPLYDLSTLTAVLAVPGSVLLTAELDGQMLAGSISFLRDRCLLIWSAGVDYLALKTHHPYVFLLYETIVLALNHGCRFIDFGRGTFEFKRRHGFMPTELHTLIYSISIRDSMRLEARLQEMNDRIRQFIDF